jgi:hypothetical protein
MGQIPIRAIFQQKLSEIVSWAARSQRDLPADADSDDQNDSAPVSRLIGYLSSRELRPPE